MKRLLLHAAAASAIALSAGTASAANLTWADITAGGIGTTLGGSGASTYGFTFDLGATGTIVASVTTSANHAGSVIIASNGESSQVEQHTTIQYPDTSTDTLTHTTGELARFTFITARDNSAITFDFSNYTGILDELVLAVDHVAGRDRLGGDGRTQVGFTTAPVHLAADLQTRASDNAGASVSVGSTGSAFEALAGAGGDGDFYFNDIAGSFNMQLDRGQGDTVYFGFADQGNVVVIPPPTPVSSPALMSLLLAGMSGVFISRRRSAKRS